MRGLFILILIVLLLSVGMVALIEEDPGYVLISYGISTVEMSIWIGLLLLVVFNLLFYGLLRGMRKLWISSGILSGWFSSRKQTRGRKLTTQGLVSFAEGNWARARRVMLRAAPQADAPMVNYLVAARASHRLGDKAKAEEYLAAATEQGSTLAIALARAELSMEEDDHEGALAALGQLSADERRKPPALPLYYKALLGSDKPEEMVEVLTPLSKHKLLNADELKALTLHVHGSLLTRSLSGDEPGGLDQGRLDTVHKAWNSAPVQVRQQPEMISRYVRALLACDAGAEAEKVLVRALKRDWSSELVTLYGQVVGKDAAKQLKLAEGWLSAHDKDAALQLSLGRLSLRNELWEKARGYFESSHELDPRPETCAELARLLFNLGERERSADYFQQGLVGVDGGSLALPQPPAAEQPAAV